MNLKKTLLGAFASLLLVVGAGAVPVYDLNLDAQIISVGNPFTNTFDVRPSGYDPATQYITGAIASFTLFDVPVFGGAEKVSITLDDLTISHGSFGGLLLVGDFVLGNALFDLSSDGQLSYTVSAASGSFVLLTSQILANAELKPVIPPTTVPDGGTTAALLGLGLGGIALARRKFAAA